LQPACREPSGSDGDRSEAGIDQHQAYRFVYFKTETLERRSAHPDLAGFSFSRRATDVLPYAKPEKAIHIRRPDYIAA
jgi:hypothetical protein